MKRHRVLVVFSKDLLVETLSVYGGIAMYRETISKGKMV
jgi:hypothetical protein